MIFPDINRFTQEACSHNLIPVTYSYIADMETPISVFMKLKANYLLESVEKGYSVGRYSIIAKGKKQQVTLNQKNIIIQNFQNDAYGETEVSKEERTYDNPLDYLKEWMSLHSSPVFNELPPYFGGWMGYLGHEAVHFFEPKVPVYPAYENHDQLHVPDGILVFPELIIVFDNVKKILWLIKLIKVEGKNQNKLEELYQNGVNELKTEYEKINSPFNYSQDAFVTDASSRPNSTIASATTPNTVPNTVITQRYSEEEFKNLVYKTKDYIQQGEVIQTVISNRFTIPSQIDPFEIYRTLKSQNPSPYLFYLDFKEFRLIGSSPEVMVMLQGDEILIKPIAGTRPRGKTLEEDEQFKRDLLNDEKELAEHIMLVDLGRNDVSRVAKPGSVTVENYMNVEKYSQVQHIVSTVKGRKQEGYDAFDLIAATFPAGTLTGAPKIRAMQIIHELEQDRRGPYGGMVLFLSMNGDLNSCITIRTILHQDSHLHIQAGAGLVHDSEPESEYQECHNKALALIKAVKHTHARIAKKTEKRAEES